MFDPIFYTYQNSKDLSQVEDSYWHYIKIGAWRGMNPHPLVDSQFILKQVPILAWFRINPIFYYLMLGRWLGLQPHPLFDQKKYLSGVNFWQRFAHNPIKLYLKGGQNSKSCIPDWYLQDFIQFEKSFSQKKINPLVYFCVKEYPHIKSKILRMN